ncbi:MAG TPA: DUF502 domain-containing protein [Smithellaceae bacterium]|nr:DUF502 domain-containing protein [Smithellaceae bacterium]
MKKFVTYFFKGILILVPIVLTIYIVVIVFQLTDSILGRYFVALGIKIPGLGLLTTIVLIILVGFLGTQVASGRIFNYIDGLFGKLPLIKIIYNTIKDIMNALLGRKSSFAKVVMIDLPGGDDIKILGFITKEDLEIFGLKDHIAVYILQSMQWAGFTLLVPRSQVQELDVKPDEALKFIVSAGISGNRNSLK